VFTGAFHSTQNSGNFGCYIKWNGPFRFGPTGIFGTSFEGVVVPSTALLYPACKNNNQARGGFGRLCATGMYRSIEHVKLPKFQTGIFVEWKAPHITQKFLFRDRRGAASAFHDRNRAATTAQIWEQKSYPV